MLRGLVGISCLMVAGGCVALNSKFEDSATEGTGSSDTAQRPTSESDSDPSAGGGSSAVTTVTAGEPSGSGTTDPTDSGGPVSSESGSSADDATGGTSVGESGETGGTVCEPLSAVVEDDAFLQTCGEGDCANRNYGQTPFGTLGGVQYPSVLLLRVPVPSESAEQIVVTLDFVVEGDSQDTPFTPFTLMAYPITPPCDWVEGALNAEPLPVGQAGVTYAACSQEEGTVQHWEGEGTVLDHINVEWSTGEMTVGEEDFVPSVAFSASIALDRMGAGPTPDSLLITADVPTLGRLFVYTSEGDTFAPEVAVLSTCR